MPQTLSPTRRADAQRNREKILVAARAAFTGPDAQASMNEISRRAGVGMATLYRNFPGRRELLEALLTDEVNALCEAAETGDGETPAAACIAWLHRFFAFSTGKRPVVAELLSQSGSCSAMFDDSRTRVLAAGRPLLAAAQHARKIRDDLTLEQVLDLVVAIATIDGEVQYLEPILRSALDGLQVPTDPRPA